MYRESTRLVLDSDSSAFSWLRKGVRHSEFPKNYMEHIHKFLGHVDDILVSSHKEVREALQRAGMDFTLVYPLNTTQVKQEYLDRYESRGSDEAFIKLMDANWDKFLTDLELQEDCHHVVLASGEYLWDYYQRK